MHSEKIPRSFGTHDGSFHADEVTACALLLFYRRIDRDLIVRTRDPSRLSGCDYVCDVGGIYDPKERRFDHHQVEYSGTLSSAGMVLLYLKEQGSIDPVLYTHLNDALMMGVDAHDTGNVRIERGICTFSQVISNFLPIEYESTPEEMMHAFFVAVEFAFGHLERLHQRHVYTVACRAMVQEKMQESGYALIFERPIPWMENFFELGGEVHPAQFVIMPSGAHWKLRGIPPSMSDRMNVRRPLPKQWAGLHDQQLQAASGIVGAVFCHKGRFISIWKTKEDAVHALRLALQEKNLSNNEHCIWTDY
jgi:uncharacterized UPF0160 family protein